MSPWGEFLSAVRFGETEETPVALLGTLRFFAGLSQYSIFDCMHDPRKMTAVQAAAFERFPGITFFPGAWPDYGGTCVLPSMAGCAVRWAEEMMPSVVRPVIGGASDIRGLTVPDVESEGLGPWYLKSLALFARNSAFEDRLHFLWSVGPGELASYLWGLTPFLENILLERELVRELLEKSTDIIVTWIEAQARILPQAEGILLTDDIAGMMSRETYEECIFPHHCRIRRAFSSHILLLHCDTKADHILGSLAATGIDAFNLGATTSIARAREEMAGKVALVGNVDPLLLQSGSAEAVAEAARRCLAEAGDRRGFVLSAGGGLNERTPVENIEALAAASRDAD